MPYIVVKTNQKNVGFKELDGPIVIGRSSECELPVRDVVLSRKHCKLESNESGWWVSDLQSKNGTSLNGDRLNGNPVLLNENDVIRLGRTKIIFYAGIPDEEFAQRLLAPARPTDPNDSVSGTVAGFTLLQPGETEVGEDMPLPQPRPKAPVGLQQEDIQQLLVAIASSSWDSIYAEARQPMRRTPGQSTDEPRRRVARPRSPIDMSLQAESIAGDVVEDQSSACDVELTAPNESAPISEMAAFSIAPAGPGESNLEDESIPAESLQRNELSPPVKQQAVSDDPTIRATPARKISRHFATIAAGLLLAAGISAAVRSMIVGSDRDNSVVQGQTTTPQMNASETRLFPKEPMRNIELPITPKISKLKSTINADNIASGKAMSAELFAPKLQFTIDLDVPMAPPVIQFKLPQIDPAQFAGVDIDELMK